MGLVKVLSDAGSFVDSQLWAPVCLRCCRTVTRDLRNARPEVCKLLRPSSTLWLDPATRSAGLAGHVSLMFRHAVRLDGLFGPASCMPIISIFWIIFPIWAKDEIHKPWLVLYDVRIWEAAPAVPGLILRLRSTFKKRRYSKIPGPGEGLN